MTLRLGLAEFLGTLLLIVAVVGSGIMGVNMASGNAAIALLANAIATGAALYVLINIFGPISGAHFNPVVTAYTVIQGQLSVRRAAVYIAAQFAGGVCGIFVTHYIFALPILQWSTHVRTGGPQWVSEAVATFGLLLTIAGFSKYRPTATPAGVALYIVGAYWFTSSTSFANPAVTFARMWSDTFAGIAPASVPGYMASQVAGLVLFMLVWRVLAEKDDDDQTAA